MNMKSISVARYISLRVFNTKEILEEKKEKEIKNLSILM